MQETEKNYNTNGKKNHSGSISIFNNTSVLISLILNFASAVIEIIGGLSTNSTALFIDAVLKLNYSEGLFFIPKKKKQIVFSDAENRRKIIFSFFKSIILSSVVVVLLIKSYKAFNLDKKVNPHGVLILGIIAALSNLFSLIVLLNDNDKKTNKLIQNQLFCFVSSLLVLSSGIYLLYFESNWITPFITIVIGLIIFKEIYENIEFIFSAFLKLSPIDINTEKIKSEIEKYIEVKKVYKINILGNTDRNLQLICHIETKSDLKLSETRGVRKQIKEMLRKEFKIQDATIQFKFSKKDSSHFN